MKRLVVVGAGPGGNTAALTAARHGCESVVLVEKGEMGGTCTNRGCIPTKFLLSRLEKNPPEPGREAEAWRRFMSHKDALVRGLSSSIAKTCLDAGVEIVKGTGRVAGPGTVEVQGEAGRPRKIDAERIVIATGSAPAILDSMNIDGRIVLTSTEALNLPEPPRSIVIIGSGAVGSEFAFIFHRAGAKVTIIEGEEHLFPGEDPEVHNLFLRIFRKMGCTVVTGQSVVSATAEAGKGRVALSSGEIIEADRVLVGVGRRFLTGGIGLEEAGVKLGARGEILTDDTLVTSRPDIMAVGDVTGRLLLAHLASYQGVQAALRALGRPFRAVPYDAVPWSIFTTPEIATVGINEREGERRGMELISSSIPWMDNIKARIDRETDGFVKLTAQASTGVIVGGTVVGAHAADMIHIVASLVHLKATVGDAAGMVFAHPGLAETIHDVLQNLQHALSASAA